jgi:RNA polymerase sigma-70 factor (ECF subfamily)
VASEPVSNRGADQERFVALLAQHHSRLLGYILSLVRHRHDAEDLFQKVSLILWQKFDEFDPATDFFAWGSRVSFLVVCNHRRAHYRNKLTFNQSLFETISRERIAHLQDQETRLDLLLGCIERLPADDQVLLLKTSAGDLSVKEFARHTGKAVQTLYNRLALLRRDLMECVQKKSSALRV